MRTCFRCWSLSQNPCTTLKLTAAVDVLSLAAQTVPTAAMWCSSVVGFGGRLSNLSNFLNYRSIGTTKDKLVIYIIYYVFVQVHYTYSLLYCCAFFPPFGPCLLWGVFHQRPKCSGRSPRAPFVRHDFLGGGCPERDLKMVVDEWRLWTGPWEGWWDDVWDDDGMMIEVTYTEFVG